jgi:hypothetical protein
MHEVFGTPVWVQPNYEEYKDYLVGRGEELPKELMALAK